MRNCVFLNTRTIPGRLVTAEALMVVEAMLFTAGGNLLHDCLPKTLLHSCTGSRHDEGGPNAMRILIKRIGRKRRKAKFNAQSVQRIEYALALRANTFAALCVLLLDAGDRVPLTLFGLFEVDGADLGLGVSEITWAGFVVASEAEDFEGGYL